MLLNIIFLCLIASITSVSGDCDDGISEGKSFDWYKVGISVLTRFLKQATFKAAACVYILFVVPLTNTQ
jgi:hypothetical protein